jgi:hypothetical protein
VATLYINRSDSRCGACDKGADPYEESHITLTGWFAVNDNMKGCGAVYDSVSTDYFNSKDLIGDIKDIRPDLPYIERY